MTNISVSAADIALFITALMSFGVCAMAIISSRLKLTEIPAMPLAGVWLLMALRDIVHIVTLSDSTATLSEYHYVAGPLITVLLIYAQQVMLQKSYNKLIRISITSVSVVVGIIVSIGTMGYLNGLLWGSFIGFAVAWWMLLSGHDMRSRFYALLIAAGIVAIGYGLGAQMTQIDGSHASILLNVTQMPSILTIAYGSILLLLGGNAYITKIGVVKAYGQPICCSAYSTVIKVAIVLIPVAACITVQSVGSTAEHMIRQELLRMLRISSLNVNTKQLVEYADMPVAFMSIEGQAFSRPLAEIVSVGEFPSSAYIMVLKSDKPYLVGTSSNAMADKAELSNGQWVVPQVILRALVMQRQTVTEPYKNDLGSWVTGIVPIYKPGTRFFVGALLFDVPATLWTNTIMLARRAVMMVFGLIELLLFILLVGVMHANLVQHLADIAENKSRLMLESLVNNLPGYAYMMDAESRFMVVNPAMANLLARPSTEIVGRYGHELLSPELAKVIRCDVGNEYKADQPVEQLTSDVTVNNQTMSLVNRIMPVYDEIGRLTGIVGLATDVTEIIAARRQLAEMNQALNAALEEGQRNLKRIDTIMRTIPSPIFYKSLSGHMLMCNQAFEELAGLKMDQMQGQTAEQLGIADRIGLLNRNDSLVISNRQVVTAEGTVRYPDGVAHQMVMHTAAYIDQYDEVAGFVSSLVDITHLLRVEHSLEVSEQRLRQIVGVMSDLVWETDREMVVTFISDRITPVLGYDPDVVMKTPLHNLAADQSDEIRQLFSVDEVVKQREVQFRHADGRIVYLELSAVPLYTITGEWDGFRGVARDISERLKAQHEQQRLLEMSNKLNSGLTEVVHLISHELKQPLRAISTLAQMLKMDKYNQLDGEGREIVRNMEGRTKKLFQTMDVYSLMAEIYSADEPITEVNLALALQEVIHELNPPRWVTIDISPDMPVLKCRRNLTLNLFKQLIANSINFMDRADGLICLDWRKVSGGLYFAVIDNGPGIDPRYHEIAFEAFQQIDVGNTENLGAGLGLSFARRVVDLHGGQIGIQAHVNQGTMIWFIMPTDPKPSA